MTWVAVAVTAAAALTSAYNTRRTAQKQDRALAEGIRQQAKIQKRGNQQISDALSKLEKSRPGAEQASALEQYRQAIRGTEQQARSGQAVEGLSEAYDEATRAGTATAQGNVGNIADLLSRIDAPGLQRQREAIGTADLGLNLSTLGRDAQGADFLSRMKAQNIRRNPWLDAAAAAMNSYAGGGGFSGGATGTNIGGYRASGVSGTPQTTASGAGYGGYA